MENQWMKNFGIHTFNPKTFSEFLDPKESKQLEDVMKHGGTLEAPVKESIAQAVKKWSIGLGAYTYCHWFQPLNQIIAEKHDSFLSLDSQFSPVEGFSSQDLLQAEPDASSFPSGGLRHVSTARGYTLWDPTSPIFIMESHGLKTLHIPSVFISYTGESLDHRLPLLKSTQKLSQVAVKTLSLLGRNTIKNVHCTVGPEQEFFLIPQHLYQKRLDLILTGRSLFGYAPPKGQEMEDFYFSPIPQNIGSLLKDVETELFKMGVPAKTRHSEVAPCQYEIACYYNLAHIASDQNYLVMHVVKNLARSYGYEALFHEKPFAHFNGSGKHINWSLMTNEGKNLLDIPKTNEEALVFLTFLTSIIHGLSLNGASLGASIASASNDLRLGANEAPPALFSVYLGEYLTSLIDSLLEGKINVLESSKEISHILLDQLPVGGIQPYLKDRSDRNRTAPFAFTGNKFEFRAAGSLAPITFPLTLINSAVIDGLSRVNEEISKDPHNILKALQKILSQSRQICFEGDGYSSEWLEEAQKRGLPVLANTLESLEYLKAHYNFVKDIFTEKEWEARMDIFKHQYESIRQCEAHTFIEIYDKQIFLALLQFQNLLGTHSHHGFNQGFAECETHIKNLKQKLENQESGSSLLESLKECEKSLNFMEKMIPLEIWKIPNFSQILFGWC